MSGGKQMVQLKATWGGAATWFKSCVSCQFVTGGMAAGMFAKAQSVCVLGIVIPGVHSRFIYTAVWREKKACDRNENSTNV